MYDEINIRLLTLAAIGVGRHLQREERNATASLADPSVTPLASGRLQGSHCVPNIRDVRSIPNSSAVFLKFGFFCDFNASSAFSIAVLFAMILYVD
jgi:hypothetical protein